MKKELCIVCKASPIFVKKRRMCSRCAQVYYKSQVKSCGIKHQSNMDFIKTLNHANWVYQPAVFKLPDDTTYQPDFYDGGKNAFITVVDTSKTTDENKARYILFTQTYPRLKFEVRYATGELLFMDGVFCEKK